MKTISTIIRVINFKKQIIHKFWSPIKEETLAVVEDARKPGKTKTFENWNENE